MSLELIYCIPPYLLNTCVGSNLQAELLKIDQSLGLLNVISVSSPNYYYKNAISNGSDDENGKQDATNGKQDSQNGNKNNHTDGTDKNTFVNGDITDSPTKNTTNVSFSDDFWLDHIIRQKALYKLALLGILGDNPMAKENIDYYLIDILNQFKDRFDVNTMSSKDDTVGEIDLNPSMFSNLPSSHAKYLSMPLKELLALTNFKTHHKFTAPPSFIVYDKFKFFDYVLPISWIPLIPSKLLPLLTRNYGLEIVNNNGFSSINLSTNYNTPKFDENIIKKSFNFIGDKPIQPSTGIYYYEIEILQQATSATYFKPLILVNDSSISSDSTLHVSAGFIKRQVSFESSSLPSNFQSSPDKLDLKKIANDILCNEKYLVDELANSEVETLLTTKPGEFKGSFAVNFEDLTFYNSIKNAQWTQRSSSISRKNENGKIDIGVPFKTQVLQNEPDKKIYKFDVIGCGINFIDKSIFITLNGVLAKVITKEDLDLANPIADKLFYDSNEKNHEASVLPIIGFELNDCPNIKPGKPSKCTIKTNLGFKEFKFNISNYVKTFKDENQRYLALLDKDFKLSETFPSLEIPNTNRNKESISLDKLIKGYLNHEGYNDTFNAFNRDLENMAKEINHTDEKVNKDDNILTKSHASNRQLVKNYMLNYEFDHSIKFLTINYPNIFSTAKGENVIFQLEILHLIYKLKQFLERTLNLNNYEFEFEFNESKSQEELYEEAFSKCKQLRAVYHEPARLETIEHLSSLLLVVQKSDLDKLPVAQALLNNFQNDIKLLLSEINKLILKSLGFKNTSNLEIIFDNVSKNIKTLGIDHNDDRFMLVNFEKDHMDL